MVARNLRPEVCEMTNSASYERQFTRHSRDDHACADAQLNSFPCSFNRRSSVWRAGTSNYLNARTGARTKSSFKQSSLLIAGQSNGLSGGSIDDHPCNFRINLPTQERFERRNIDTSIVEKRCYYGSEDAFGRKISNCSFLIGSRQSRRSRWQHGARCHTRTADCRFRHFRS